MYPVERTLSPRASLLELHRPAIVEIARRHRGQAVSVFGSVARGDDTADSDIDFLVEFEPGSSLFDLMHLEDELAEFLGCRVDVVSAGALLDRDDDIRRDAIRL
jgi:uncharacterized protein